MLCYAFGRKYQCGETGTMNMGAVALRARCSVVMTAVCAGLLIAQPAAAQFSDSYKFLKAVRDADGAKVTEVIDQPGSTLINTKDYGTGEGALHIVVKRRDANWLAFLLQKGANPDIRDGQGNTPLLIAAQLGFVEGVQILTGRAGVNIGNSRGETPLILAVHNRDAATVRVLLAAGANPLQPDRIAGKSARDYATEDRRAAVILKLLDDAKPVKPAGRIAGPGL
jgi:hypothetical protein